MMAGMKPAIRSPDMPAAMSRAGGCAETPRDFSVILSVTAEKLPYRDWGCGGAPRYFSVILTVTSGNCPIAPIASAIPPMRDVH
jgi:hypothetical protein